MHPVAAFLRAHGLRLHTDLGQHFLIDAEVLQAIVDAAHIRPSDHVVEIGPGIGVLTVELLKRAAHVTAIELDERMIPLLKEFIQMNESTKEPFDNASVAARPRRDGQDRRMNELTIIHGNALAVPLPSEPYRIVANIPYHITSPLLRHVFLEGEGARKAPITMTLLLQREVAEKIVDEENRGILTILVGLFGKPRLVRIVKPECFLPPPAVDSAVLHVECFDRPLADAPTIEEVFRLVKLGFSQKRKMLRNTIGGFPGGMERLSAAGIEPTRRPQTLSVHEWIALAQTKSDH